MFVSDRRRRRIDQVLDPDFLADLDEAPLEELRARKALASEVENELSYYRRVLHGRIDLIRFEQRRRRGDETRRLIDALPEILSEQLGRGGSEMPRTFVTDLPPLPETGRRDIDHILSDEVLLRLDEMSDERLQVSLDALLAMEREVSESRRRVQQVEDRLGEALAERYRSVGA